MIQQREAGEREGQERSQQQKSEGECGREELDLDEHEHMLKLLSYVPRSLAPYPEYPTAKKKKKSFNLQS